jgi:hypothetical protein
MYMRKKLISIALSFFVFLFSLPCGGAAEAFLLRDKNASPEISDKAMKALNLLDVSKNIAGEYFAGGKAFFVGDCFFDNAGKKAPLSFDEYSINLFFGFMKNDIIIPEKKTFTANSSASMFNAIKEAKPPDKHRSSIIGFADLSMLSLDALRKGNVPADGILNLIYAA